MAEQDKNRITVDGRRIDLSNRDKVLFPETGLTKGDLIDYYRRIAPHALPHYRDRPLTMHRFPDGIGEEGFFQKQTPDYFPAWVETARMPKENGTITHVVANDAATLVYLANQGCITPHLSLARRDKLNHPDRLIFDLDPSDDDFGKVQDAAKKLKALLDGLEVPSFVQTTGSRGLHVITPLDRTAEFDAVRDFARRVAERLAERHGQTLTVEQRKNKRGDRVFIDYLRNAYGQTAVAPFAVRPREGAPIATPVRWDEAVAGDLGPQTYRITNIFRRLARIEDPWRGMDSHACSIETAANRLAEGA